MDRPWNQDEKSLPRIKNYEEFYNLFSNKLENKISKNNI